MATTSTEASLPGSSDPADPDPTETLSILREGDLEVIGRIEGSSNNALLVTVSGTPAIHAIYKPIAGERPLFDFPVGTLTHREVAAWLVSEASGWGIVPPTVQRDGPYGPGMIQAFVERDPSVDVVAMIVEDDPRLRRMAALDAAINNTDRKGGHILPVEGGRRIMGVDHGVCFSEDPKLRTVLWGWRGQPMDEDELIGLRRIQQAMDGQLGRDLAALLSDREIAATAERTDSLLKERRFPLPSEDWPAIPWPPF